MATVVSGHRLLDRTFFVSVIVKGLHGLLELVGGILLLMVKPDQINAVTRFLTQHEIDQDPHDFIDTRLRTLTAHLSVSSTLFDAAYLLLHGIVKMVLVWALLRGHLRAYPWTIAFLLAFIGFQLNELVHNFYRIGPVDHLRRVHRGADLARIPPQESRTGSRRTRRGGGTMTGPAGSADRRSTEPTRTSVSGHLTLASDNLSEARAQKELSLIITQNRPDLLCLQEAATQTLPPRNTQGDAARRLHPGQSAGRCSLRPQ